VGHFCKDDIRYKLLSGARQGSVAERYTGEMPPMRPKARGLVQHGGPPGWQEERDQAGVVLFVMDGLVPPGCCYIVNVHNHPS
jgi:hypothetical protein